MSPIMFCQATEISMQNLLSSAPPWLIIKSQRNYPQWGEKQRCEQAVYWSATLLAGVKWYLPLFNVQYRIGALVGFDTIINK